MKARTLLVIFAAVVALVAAPAAKAACSPAHAFYGYDLNAGTTSYIFFPGMNTTFETNLSAPTGGLIGRLWQAGARASNNEGGLACALSTWLNPPTATENAYYINGALTGVGPDGGVCDVIGCPANSMIVVIEATRLDGRDAYVVASKAVEDPAAPAFFTYVNENNWILQPIPKPYVLASTKAGSAVNLSMNMRNADITPTYQGTPGFPLISGVITGMNLYRYQGTADPGRGRNRWGTAVATNLAYTGSDVPIAPQAADCSNAALNTYYAASLLFDNGALESDYVSAAVAVNCNPALADPGKYKKVDRKKK